MSSLIRTESQASRLAHWRRRNNGHMPGGTGEIKVIVYELVRDPGYPSSEILGYNICLPNQFNELIAKQMREEVLTDPYGETSIRWADFNITTQQFGEWHTLTKDSIDWHYS